MTCIVLFLLACYTQHLSLYLETVVLTSVSCSCFLFLFGFVLICIVSVSFVCLSFSDKFHVRLFVQQNLRTYEMIYVCMLFELKHFFYITPQGYWIQFCEFSHFLPINLEQHCNQF